MYQSKKAFVETLRSYRKHILSPLFLEAADIIEELMAEVERKNDSCAIKTPGHWIFKAVDDDPQDPVCMFQHRYECSVCGKWQSYGMTDFCPNCGNPMIIENSQEETEHEKENN